MVPLPETGSAWFKRQVTPEKWNALGRPIGDLFRSPHLFRSWPECSVVGQVETGGENRNFETCLPFVF